MFDYNTVVGCYYGMLPHTSRSNIKILICIRFFAILTILLSSSVDYVEGRKCVCTSKACKEAGVDTCKTKHSCYTELIQTGNQEYKNITTRGCTEGATPLLCETKSWVTKSKSNDNLNLSSAAWVRMSWPTLKCCDDHDYCNADRHLNEATSTEDKQNFDSVKPVFKYNGSMDGASWNHDMIGSNKPVFGEGDDEKSSDQFIQTHVKPLHVAALVLAIAALISVLAACYVITRFVKSNPRNISSIE